MITNSGPLVQTVKYSPETRMTGVQSKVESPNSQKMVLVLYIDLRPRHSKDGGSAYSIGVGELGWQYGTGLKSHGTVTDWCTGREWPVNCVTVISAWGRSNMPFQRRWKCIFRWPIMGSYWVGVKYYTTECTGNSISLERRCGREKTAPGRTGPRDPRLSFGDQIS